VRSTDDPDEYAYDVFVSYKREPKGEELLTPWIREVVKRVRLWLGLSLGGVEARVFLDTDALKAGISWPAGLQHAIGASRCLLPIWSPAYFRSPWCLAEWQSFLARERLVGPAASLVVPIIVHDGAWFPSEAQRVMMLDLCEYAATTAAFWQTRRADELDILLRQFAESLAHVVRSAPPYRSDWPVLKPPGVEPPDTPPNLPMVDP
jgi:TIR domain-containing protein